MATEWSWEIPVGELRERLRAAEARNREYEARLHSMEETVAKLAGVVHGLEVDGGIHKVRIDQLVQREAAVEDGTGQLWRRLSELATEVRGVDTGVNHVRDEIMAVLDEIAERMPAKLDQEVLRESVDALRAQVEANAAHCLNVDEETETRISQLAEIVYRLEGK